MLLPHRCTNLVANTIANTRTDSAAIARADDRPVALAFRGSDSAADNESYDAADGVANGVRGRSVPVLPQHSGRGCRRPDFR